MCPPQKLILKTLDYDPETGVFVYRPRTGQLRWDDIRWNEQFAGQVAGKVQKSGYVRISVWGRSYFAHRLAWVYVHGSIPLYIAGCDCPEIDHINGIRHDNRLVNLELVPHAVNKQRAHDRKRGYVLEVYHT